eukprot:1290287-Amphidinium_carterae.1
MASVSAAQRAEEKGRASGTICATRLALPTALRATANGATPLGAQSWSKSPANNLMKSKGNSMTTLSASVEYQTPTHK